MRVENGKLVMERKDCHWCDKGKRPGQKPCKTCKGSGRGPRGKVRGCRKCFGNGRQPDFENTVVCDLCNGSWHNSQPEDLCDTLPEEIWHALPFKVYRRNISMSFNERWFGAGCVFSCEDYGRAWAKDDATIIAEVKEYCNHQASKIAKEDGTLCNHVAIVVKPSGYVVLPAFQD